MVEDYELDILRKLKGISLEELSETLPSSLTTDAQILKGEQCFSQQQNWEAFHHFSLTHSTLLYHKLNNKYSSLGAENVDSRETFTTECADGKKRSFNIADILRPNSWTLTKEMIQTLPSDWTVIQVTNDGRISGQENHWRKFEDPLQLPSLYISRCKCGPAASIIIKKVNPPKRSNTLNSFLHELETILAENKVILKHHSADYSKYLLKKEELNDRLKIFVQSMEVAWLKNLSCMFVGSLSPEAEEKVMNKVKDALAKLQITLSDDQIDLLVLMVTFPNSSSNPLLSANSLLKLGVALTLGDSVRSERTKGLTNALIKIRTAFSAVSSSSRGPVILILDKVVTSIPFEMITPMQFQTTTRMPSFQSLVYLYMYHSQIKDSVLINGINPSSGYFIVDPENNLPRTTERLKDTFKKTNWAGIVGKVPPHEEFKESLEQKDLVVYVGHGSGSQYLPSKLIEGFECRSAVMLFGCSSVSLSRKGSIIDPSGVILNYLQAACPCVVGMLWDVMDKDTDLLTKEIVRSLMGLDSSLVEKPTAEEPRPYLPSLVARSRPLCSWYLISAAFVVYGLPLRVNLKTVKTNQANQLN